MASSSSSRLANKLIFAPGSISDPSSTQAAQFSKATLDIPDLDPSPLRQFSEWFQAAREAGIPQSEACTLATAELPSGRVSARVVYMKELIDDKGADGSDNGISDNCGWIVYSNWGTSRKAEDVATNPNVALSFWWREAERQVRIEGRCVRISKEDAQIYFDTRARGSRIGAWASQQSRVLKDRKELESQFIDQEKRWNGHKKIEVPEFWGGLRVIPESVEFWQGRDSRLHDRFIYKKMAGHWNIERLSP